MILTGLAVSWEYKNSGNPMQFAENAINTVWINQGNYARDYDAFFYASY